MVNQDIAEPLVDKERASSVCLDWDDGETPDVQVDYTQLDGGSPKEDEEGGIFVAVCSLLAAVPALIGSWCWPILVGAIFAVAAGNVNGGLVDFFHGVQVAVMLALMTNIVQFAYWKCAKKKADTHWNKFGPVYILLVATLLVLVQPTCMLVIGSWGAYSPNVAANMDDLITDPSIIAYLQGKGVDINCGEPLDDSIDNFFFDGDDNPNALTPNTVTGWMIQIFCTYVGFAFMFWGVVWATNLHNKIAKKWRLIRQKQQRTPEASLATPVPTATMA